MRESLARIMPSAPEELPVEELRHPEAANDDESSQPISTIYSEASPTRSANDNEADTIALAQVRESLGINTQEVAEGEETSEPTPEAIDSAQEEAGTESVELKSEQPLANGAGNTVGGGTTGGPQGPGSGVVGSQVTKKKGFLGKVWSFTKGAIGIFLKGIYLLGAAALTGVLYSLKKIPDEALKRGGFKEGGGGGSAPKKPSGGGGGAHH